MSFYLTILGSNSAVPAHNRHHTAQVLVHNNKYFLIDCGEGTQERLKKYKISETKINHIFISHLHGDHYLGLMGLIFSMNLDRRVKDLNIYAQDGLRYIISTQLKYSDTKLNFNINFYILDNNQKQILFDDEELDIYSFPLNHRIPCCGFLFKEKQKKYKLNKEVIPNKLPIKAIKNLQKGLDYTSEDNIFYSKAKLTIPPKLPRSYAFCSDTKYDEQIIEYIKGVNVLYHETTFLKDKEEWATTTFHSTTVQAGEIAKKSNVSKLLIGHFSSRHKDLEQFLNETKSVFSRTELSVEGKTYLIDF